MTGDADDTAAGRLVRVEGEIGKHRLLYLRAKWAGHEGEADWHETEVDRLLSLWQDLYAGRSLAAAVTEETPL